MDLIVFKNIFLVGGFDLVFVVEVKVVEINIIFYDLVIE